MPARRISACEPAMSVLVVRVEGSEVDACSDWLWQLGATAIEERAGVEHITLVAGFGDDDRALAARSILGERWPSRIESTGDESSWRDEWLRWIEPIEVAGFVVHAPWHDPENWTDRPAAATLSIDPGRAFGSGHHPTTRLMLEALRDHVSPGDHVLDVGCGTGILSIAAARFGATSVTGIDLDHDIIEVARANVEANNTSGIVELKACPLDQLNDDYDLIAANIVIGDLMRLMPAIAARNAATTIISGFLNGQLGQLVNGLQMHVSSLRSLDDWQCAVLHH